MAFSFTDYAAMKPGEDRFNPLQAILQGMQMRNQMDQQRAALQQTLLGNQKSQAQQPYWGQQAQADLQHTQAQIPLLQAQTGKLTEETKYTPLEMAIKAQNSARESSRFNGAYQLQKTLSEMSPADRASWISRNSDQFNQMLSTISQAANTTPTDYVGGVAKNFFPQQGGPNASSNASSNANSMLPQQLQQQQQPGDNQIAGKAFNPQVQQQLQQQQNPQNPMNLTGVTQAGPQLSDAQALQFGMQDTANRKTASPEAVKRAESAITYEKWLSDNREKYSSAINSASKYPGWIGRGKNYLAQISTESPEDYQNLVWLKTSFIPSAINQIKRMEGLSSSNKQRAELRDTLGALDRFDLDPKAAMKAFQNQMKTTQDISNSVINTAEPRYKGVMRRQAGIPDMQGDYVLPPKSGEGQNPGAAASATPNSQAVPEQTRAVNGKQYHKINGQWYPVMRNQ